MMYPTIEKISEDGLTVETWRFCVIDTRIILDDYRKVVRQSRRHKNGTVTGHYNRLSARESTLTETNVPWSDEIAKEALNLFVQTLRVGRWQTDFGRQ